MNTLLVVIDMQNDFIDGALGTKEAVAMLPCVIDKVKGHVGPIIFTRDTHDEQYLETQEGRNLPVVHCVKGTEGWQIQTDLYELAKENNSVILDKPTFGSVELGEMIAKMYEDHKIDEVELVGLCTDICVIANAMTIKSCSKELPVRVDSSCCAGVTPESHRTALDAMTMCQITIK